jgi:hypothetical protein
MGKEKVVPALRTAGKNYAMDHKPTTKIAIRLAGISPK